MLGCVFVRWCVCVCISAKLKIQIDTLFPDNLTKSLFGSIHHSLPSKTEQHVSTPKPSVAAESGIKDRFLLKARMCFYYKNFIKNFCLFLFLCGSRWSFSGSLYIKPWGSLVKEEIYRPPVCLLNVKVLTGLS